MCHSEHTIFETTIFINIAVNLNLPGALYVPLSIPVEAKAAFEIRRTLYRRSESYLNEGPRVINIGKATSRSSMKSEAGLGAIELDGGLTIFLGTLLLNLHFLKKKTMR